MVSNLSDKRKVVKLLQKDKDNQAYTILGETSGVLDWNSVPAQFYTFYKKLLANHWTADEVSMAHDISDWKLLSKEEKDAYKRIIGSLNVLDSVQTRYIMDVSRFIPNPAVNHVFSVIGKDETVHTESYSYTFASLFSSKEQLEVFESAKTDPDMVKRYEKVFELYEEFRQNPTTENFVMTLVANMALEGIYFFSGFTFFYLLAREGKMLGTAKMISLIQRDETQHSYVIAHTLRSILTENPHLNTPELTQKIRDFVYEATELEKEWIVRAVESVDNANSKDFVKFCEQNANFRMSSLGLPKLYDVTDETVSWIKAFANPTQAFTDFFEQKVSSYQRVNKSNGFNEL